MLWINVGMRGGHDLRCERQDEMTGRGDEERRSLHSLELPQPWMDVQDERDRGSRSKFVGGARFRVRLLAAAPLACPSPPPTSNPKSPSAIYASVPNVIPPTECRASAFHPGSHKSTHVTSEFE